ncbi:MAG: TonB-dependent receptor [Gammaproteobacteria bacterium]|nr:TonB-dependent receptor [Gammaproteobacteria bacterium]MCW9032475.1 TonB-dependent receptor [Gammaproteobacteria bacterium]
MDKVVQTPHQKALTINLDKSRYGTLAEIGAGQETARWFFRVGAAAGTIASAMSAYDMTFSDVIYGKAKRYVSRERLQAMLCREYDLLFERLMEKRGDNTAFFAFANTVAARSYSRDINGQGWLGIRFQHKEKEVHSQIDIHVSLNNNSNLQDQETLGVLGVNLIYGALYKYENAEDLLISLLDNIAPDSVEIDMIEFSGPAFSEVDNRLMALYLVQHGLSNAAMINSEGKVVQIADSLWQKSVLIERSRFRPPTKLTVDLMDNAFQAFVTDENVDADHIITMGEMTLRDLSEEGEIDVKDFLARAELLCALGWDVLISNYGECYRLAQYLFRFTDKPIALAMGVPLLKRIFRESYYKDLPGGILESFGRLFKNDLRFYVCPMHDNETDKLQGVSNLEVAPHLQHLYRYLLDNGFVRSLDLAENENLKIYSHEVLEMIRSNNKDWCSQVPDNIAEVISKKHLFS